MCKKKHYSFIMLKPDAIKRNLVKEILSVFKRNGYCLEIFDYVLAEDEKILKHYSEKYEEEGPHFIVKARNTFHNQYVIPIIISSDSPNIIDEVRDIIGFCDPSKAAEGTIREHWAQDSMKQAEEENRCCNNLIHSCDSNKAFNKEVKIWFGDSIFDLLS